MANGKTCLTKGNDWMARFVCVHTHTHTKKKPTNKMANGTVNSQTVVTFRNGMFGHYSANTFSNFQIIYHSNWRQMIVSFICALVLVLPLPVYCRNVFLFFFPPFENVNDFWIHKWQCVRSEGKLLTNIQTFHSLPDLIFNYLDWMCDCLLFSILRHSYTT